MKRVIQGLREERVTPKAQEANSNGIDRESRVGKVRLVWFPRVPLPAYQGRSAILTDTKNTQTLKYLMNEQSEALVLSSSFLKAFLNRSSVCSFPAFPCTFEAPKSALLARCCSFLSHPAQEGKLLKAHLDPAQASTLHRKCSSSSCGAIIIIITATTTTRTIICCLELG